MVATSKRCPLPQQKLLEGGEVLGAGAKWISWRWWDANWGRC